MDRLTWLAGDAAQCDLWFPPRTIPPEDGTTALLPVLVITWLPVLVITWLPVLVITCPYSRFMLGDDQGEELDLRLKSARRLAENAVALLGQTQPGIRVLNIDAELGEDDVDSG